MKDKKEKLVISLDAEVKELLRKYAEEKHTTMSQAVTDWIVSTIKTAQK